MISVKTAIIIGVSLLAVLLGLDVYLAADGIKGNTWSEILRMWSKKTTIISWIYGGLGGHFFHWWNHDKALLGQPNSVVLLVWLTVVAAMVGVAALKMGHPIPPWAMLVPAFFAGALLWPV